MSSTIITDIITLETPIMFHVPTREAYYPEDSQYSRLLSEAGIDPNELEACRYAVRICDASGASFLDPHPSFEAAVEWIRKTLPENGVFVDGPMRKNRAKAERILSLKIPANKIYRWKERVAAERTAEVSP